MTTAGGGSAVSDVKIGSATSRLVDEAPGADAGSRREAEAVRLPVTFLWRNLSIRSKPMATLLLARLIGAGAIIAIGFRTGEEAMSEQVRERRTVVRAAKAFEIQEYFRDIAADILTEAGNATILAPPAREDDEASLARTAGQLSGCSV